MDEKKKKYETEKGDASEEITETGWAWMVLIGCFCCRALTDGLISSLGVFIISWQDHFSGSLTKLTWITSLLWGLECMLGKKSLFFDWKSGCLEVTRCLVVPCWGGLTLTWYTFICLPFELLYHKIQYRKDFNQKLGVFWANYCKKSMQFKIVHWWMNDWVKIGRESPIFEVQQAHPHSICLVRCYLNWSSILVRLTACCSWCEKSGFNLNQNWWYLWVGELEMTCSTYSQKGNLCFKWGHCWLLKHNL